MTQADREHRWTREWQRDGHRVIECDVCGYRHLHPLPDETELAAFYREHYHQEKQHIDYPRVNEAFVWEQIEALQTNREFRHIHAKVESLIPDEAPLTMIDIGGGNNLLSRFFKDKGWECTVFEPNDDAADYLRKYGLHVIASMFEHAGYAPGESYSFINLQFVLEHVLNPLDMLCQSIDMLNAGGLVRVCVPNDFSPGQMAWLGISKLDPPWISSPDHINYFDFDSLKGLMERAGLTEICRDTNFPLELLLLTETDYYSDETACERIGSLVAGFEGAWLSSAQESKLAALYESMAQVGMGRCATIYAKRS